MLPSHGHTLLSRACRVLESCDVGRLLPRHRHYLPGLLRRQPLASGSVLTRSRSVGGPRSVSPPCPLSLSTAMWTLMSAAASVTKRRFVATVRSAVKLVRRAERVRAVVVVHRARTVVHTVSIRISTEPSKLCTRPVSQCVRLFKNNPCYWLKKDLSTNVIQFVFEQ